MEEEFRAVKSALGPLRQLPSLPYYAGKDHDLIVCQLPSRGQMPATETVKALLADTRPEIVIVCGIAGGIPIRHDQLSPGDVVVPDYIHYGEYWKLTEDGNEPRFHACDQPSHSLRSIYAQPLALMGEWEQNVTARRPRRPSARPKVFVEGSLIAMEKVMGDRNSVELKRILQLFNDGAAIDMESMGAAFAVFAARTHVMYNPRILVVRGISDLVTPPGSTKPTAAVKNAEERALWKEYAAGTAAAFTAAIVDAFLEADDPRTGRLAPPLGVTQ